MMLKNNITGIILSGGKSSRMRTNKALLLYKDKPFIQHVINAMSPLVNELIIVGRPDEYAHLNLKCIDDIIENSGPLAGVYSGLEASKTKYNLILSCDVPLITTGILTTIIDHIDDESDVIQIESNGQAMPLIAIYKKHCKSLFRSLLHQGERRLLTALDQLMVKNIALDPSLNIHVTNINNPSILNKITNEVNH